MEESRRHLEHMARMVSPPVMRVHDEVTYSSEAMMRVMEDHRRVMEEQQRMTAVPFITTTPTGRNFAAWETYGYKTFSPLTPVTVKSIAEKYAAKRLRETTPSGYAQFVARMNEIEKGKKDGNDQRPKNRKRSRWSLHGW